MQKQKTIEELQKILELIEVERKEDNRLFVEMVLETSIEERKSRGITWYPITINKEYLGLGGTFVIEIETKDKNAEHNSFSNGAVVSLFAEKGRGKKNPFVGGVVKNVEKNTMTICLYSDELPEWMEDDKLGVDLGNDEKTFVQMQEAVRRVIEAKNNRLEELRDVILGSTPPKFSSLPRTVVEGINPSQQLAVDKVLCAADVAVIHGPPGTGKTTTMVKSICETLKVHEQVLVCAPSNTAVDLLAAKLIEQNIEVLRLGHPARVHRDVLDNTIDAKMLRHGDYKLLKKWRKEIQDLRAQATKYHKNFDRHKREQRKQQFLEARSLVREVQRLEKEICREILRETQAVVCTLTGANHELLKNCEFEVVFMDEAAQALEGASWIPIVKARKVIMAGDHLQLPPVVKSVEADKNGLGISLMEKCTTRQDVAVMLDTQYRMHQRIMNYSNRVFYNQKLQADRSVKERCLANEISVVDFIDTAGCGYEEQINPQTKSRYNPGEAQVLFTHMRGLIRLLSADEEMLGKLSVGIISPYKEQVRYLKEKSFEHMKIYEVFGPRLSINTIDGFQGQERDIIYISLVRSNSNSEIGFLKDIRRMNVAMTRAKQKLVVIGDSATICAEDFYNGFVEYIEEIDSYTSAWEINT
ncbi:AAA domain-containing protein [Candidatus Uabimicrobium amorphum]|uniref:DNA helicase n=1 Tax=Uabimicrobium amorphum TaxID=2596890 RepID=A0A5S9IKH3_UABAM|nr:AAA domain-containing protein [Candidatus Uabimicrobium amorphum]BBM83211.1 helicase [Candidatus Uabimicrobium amorphum]